MKINLASPYADWTKTANRFVAFLDIAGFSNKVENGSLENIHKQLLDIIAMKSNVKKNVDKSNLIYIVTISDSIIVFSKDDSAEATEKFLNTIQILVAGTIMRGNLIKGGADYGEICVDIDNQIFIGRPYINAVAIEKYLDYYGVAFGESMTTRLDSIKSKTLFFNFYIKAHTPFNNNTDKKMYGNIQWFIQIPEYVDIFPHRPQDIRTLLNDVCDTSNLSAGESSKVINRINNTVQMYENYRKLTKRRLSHQD